MREVQAQLALPLTRASIPQHERLREMPESLLRTAWERARLGIAFEEAMQLVHFRIALGRMAMIMASKRRAK